MFIETCYTHHGHRIQSENLIQKITCTVEYIYALKSGVGRDHQKGSEGLSFLLWTQTSVQTSCLTNWWGGDHHGARHGYAGHCCPYVYRQPHVSECGELHQRIPHCP